MSIGGIFPAKAALIPTSTSFTTTQSSGFTSNSFAANKKMQIIFYQLTIIINNHFSLNYY
jgi:hypothetical protein